MVSWRSANVRSLGLPGWLIPFAAATIGLAILLFSAPSYLLHQGFPLDDAWIHAVYARELARSGMLAYNPGIPATGETSPLWAGVLAIVHKATASGPLAIGATKVAGFALHLAAALVLGFAVRRLETRGRGMAWVAAGLVALHPDLIAASVSGMEVPLATLVSALVVMATVRGHGTALVILSGIAFFARPETAIIGLLFPTVFWGRSDLRKSIVLAAASAAGAVAAFGVAAWRNHVVSGLLLPATFYVKANPGSPFDLKLQGRGFITLLDQIAVVESGILLIAAASVASFFLAATATAIERVGAAMFATGLVFCAVSFALVPPADPAAFYHQRYVLPALPLLIGALPLLADALVSRIDARLAFGISGGAAAVVTSLLLAASLPRAHRLANDARNIDDVQVALGLALAGARDGDVLWTMDAGAPRYFGRAYVVDLMALNTPELLGRDSMAFLAAHPPRFFNILPGWSSVTADSGGALPTRRFETSGPYTVTSHPEMHVQMLTRCDPGGLTGHVTVRGRWLPFTCQS